MSIQAFVWAFAQNSLKSPQKFVLVTLANYADENNSCFPGQARIAEDTGMCIRSVKTCLKKLEEDGYISRESRQRQNGSRTSDRYRLHIIQGANHAPPKVQTVPIQGAGDAPPEPSLNRKETILHCAGDPLDNLARDINEAAGGAINPIHPNILMLTVPLKWIEEGCDLERDILPVIKALCQDKTPDSIKTWNYFTGAVADARANRLKPMPKGHTNGSHTGKPKFDKDAIAQRIARAAGLA